MRNACIATLLASLAALMLLMACSDDEPVVLQGDGVVYAGLQPVDSLNFTHTHHYWKGYFLRSTRPLSLQSSVPNNQWHPDTLQLPSGERLVVADIAKSLPLTPDTIWLKIVTLSDTLPLQGWISESELLHGARPTHTVARLLSPLGTLADVPGGRYPDAWLTFYFRPTANPWLLPWPMALVVLLGWGLLIGLLAWIDRLIFSRARYRCGHCGAPLRQLGRCPHCGSQNT